MKRRTTVMVVTALLAAATVTQVALPSVAEDRMRRELEPLGSVKRVNVSATPALKLLFGAVDRAEVSMQRVAVDGSTVGYDDMFGKARNVASLEASIAELRVGPMDVEDVLLDKEGASLEASGKVAVEDVGQVVPGAELKVDHGRILLELASLPLPFPGPVRLEVVVEDGAVIARPVGAAAALLPEQPLLERPGVTVTRLHGKLSEDMVLLSARGTLDDV